MREFFLMFGAQTLSYFLVTANYRAIAQAKYGWTAGTDLLYAAVTFFLIKKIADSKSKTAWLGYTLGGVAGSFAGIWLTKILYGQ
jgi:hypothetical protein